MYKKLTLLLASTVLTSQAWATPINLGGPEQNLQQVLNGITAGGTSSVNVQTDQQVPDEVWSLDATGGAMSQILVEIAGYKDINSFGVYDVTSPGKQVTLFDGARGAGSQSLFVLRNDGSVIVANLDPSCLISCLYDTGVDFAGNQFGFFLKTPYETWYSQNALNSDSADHMVSFAGKGDWVTLPSSSGYWESNEYVLGWEDLARPGWDYDYNDFVVMVESVHANVPEPGSLALFGVGLAALGWTLRRRTVSIKG
jgi:hypothetical protein